MGEPLSSKFAEKENLIARVSTTNAVSTTNDVLANRHARIAIQLYWAVWSIEWVARQLKGQEDDLADQIIATVNVSTNDAVGDDPTGHVDADVYLMDK